MHATERRIATFVNNPSIVLVIWSCVLSAITRRTFATTLAAIPAMGLTGPLLAKQSPASPSPEVVSVPAAKALVAMLSKIPVAVYESRTPNGIGFSWARPKTTLNNVGIDEISKNDPRLMNAPAPLALLDPLSSYAVTQGLQDSKLVFGFQPLLAEDILVVGTVPSEVCIYGGVTDAANVSDALVDLGYKRNESEHGEWFTRGDEFDPNSPSGQLVPSNTINYAAIRDKDVMFASSKDQIIALLSTTPSEENLPEDWVAAIPQLPDDALSAVAMPGTSLLLESMVPEGGPLPDILAESNDAVGAMPPISSALFAVSNVRQTVSKSSGNIESPGDADLNVFLQSDGAADQVGTVVTWRLEHMQSALSGVQYREILSDPSATSVDSDLTSMTARQGNPHVWINMIFGLDLLPFAWQE